MNKLTIPVEPLMIRKYGNRRLYGTDESRYVTL
jgi:polyhydroxyalkanoate synthesis regulator protein